MANYDREFLENCAQILLKAEGFQNDPELMKALGPVLSDIVEAARRLKGLDLKSMRELAGQKALEEQDEALKIREKYFKGDDGAVVLGEKQPQTKIPGKRA